VRQRGARTRRRLVDADVVGRLRRGTVVGNNGGRFVGVAVLDVELGELHRLGTHGTKRAGAELGVLGPTAPHASQQGRVLLGRVLGCHAERRRDREVVERVLQRALAVALVYRSSLGFVGVEERGRGAIGEYCCDLPAQVLHVVDGSRWSSPPRRSGVAVCRVPDEERAAAAEQRGKHGVDQPACDLADPHRHVADPQRATSIGLDLRVRLGAGSSTG
jgi:hypothetical protein